MASTTHDDGFHEIQLNGKQLVFLFMAVTVVSVVIFLCGVLVGRGVRLNGAPGPEVAEAAAGLVDAPPALDPAANSSTPSTPDEKTTYSTQLESATAPPARLEAPEAPAPKREPIAAAAPASVPSSISPGTPAAAASPVSAPPKAEEPKAAESQAAPAEPDGPGVAVQVAAFRVRAEADALANRLIGKDYQAYVVAPPAGTPAIYRVRVGKFKERRDADRVVSRLKEEEKFDPWIVR